MPERQPEHLVGQEPREVRQSGERELAGAELPDADFVKRKVGGVQRRVGNDGEQTHAGWRVHQYRQPPRRFALDQPRVCSSAGCAGATIPGGRRRKGGEAPLRAKTAAGAFISTASRRADSRWINGGEERA